MDCELVSVATSISIKKADKPLRGSKNHCWKVEGAAKLQLASLAPFKLTELEKTEMPYILYNGGMKG